MTGPDLDLRQALVRAGALGPFSSVAADPPTGSIRLQDLLEDADLVLADIEATGAALAGADALPRADGLRVSASVWQLGMAARLTTPALATAVVGGWVPDFDPARVWGSLRHRQPIPLALVDPSGRRCVEPDDTAAGFHELVIERAVAPLVAAVASVVSVSESILWGNVWSGLMGSLATISPRSDLYALAHTIVEAILGFERSVTSTRAQHVGGVDSQGHYRRSTCCLLYRLPAGGLCGDCILQ